MTKSTLFLIDAKEQLSSMKLANNDNAKTHLSEIRQHLELMFQHHKNLIEMGSEMSDNRFNTLIMTSLPQSYRPTLQTITAAKKASNITRNTPKHMKPKDLAEFLIEEAQHRVINAEQSKNSDHALVANVRKGTGKSRQKKGSDNEKQDDEIVCYNCNKPGHKKADCWSKGGGKEGQGLG